MDNRWYFDFVSPFSYLHWHKVRPWIEQGRVEAVPIVFGAVLAHLEQSGPAEIAKKRVFIYRQALWQAQRDGVPLRFPPAHPFNPLAALRLCVAAGTTPAAIDAIYAWLWRDGQAGDDATALAPVARMLGIDDAAAAIGDAAVKARLRENTGDALAEGVFGVPTLSLGGQLLWGNDSHDLMQAAMDDPDLLRHGPLATVADLPVGVQRRR